MNRTPIHWRIAAAYRKYRQLQRETYRHNGLYIDGVDQRQFTGGGAAYGCHAIAAYLSAKRHIHFMDDLAEKNNKWLRRSKAAKRGWKTRRAN